MRPGALRRGRPTLRLLAIAAALVLAAACASAPSPARLSVSPSTPEPVADVLRSMPAGSPRQENELAARLLAIPDAVPVLVGMLGATGADDDAAARYALASVSRWVTRPGARADRARFADSLVAELGSGHGGETSRFLIERLARVGGPESVAAIAALLHDPDLGDDAARALVRIGGDSARMAIVEALEDPGTAGAIDLLLAAGDLRALDATPRLRRALGSDDPGVRLAAATALADMAAVEADDDLLAAIARADPPERRALAPRVLRHGRAVAAAGDVDGGVATISAVLRLALESGDEAVAIAALRTLADVAPPAAARSLADLSAGDRSARFRATVASLESEIAEGRRLEAAAEEEERLGFRALFNGEDLSGWVGATDGWFVAGGAIVCDPEGGGNLYTAEEFGDFVLRFEFRLTPGANNGLGIRAPLEGDAAYAGMELQVLDNGAVQYADLRPYQFHGSIYGVAAAERGHLNPPGQWNEQEVLADGRRVRVTLNGATILDVDLDEVSRPETADGRDHPGLARAAGHIGFLGHGHRVEFRAIRVRDLDPASGDPAPDR